MLSHKMATAAAAKIPFIKSMAACSHARLSPVIAHLYGIRYMEWGNFLFWKSLLFYMTKIFFFYSLFHVDLIEAMERHT